MDSFNRVSRRNFLKTATLGGAALAAAPAWGRVLGANDRINVGLIGVGCRGSDHLDLLLKHREIKPDIEIVALCPQPIMLLVLPVQVRPRELADLPA